MNDLARNLCNAILRNYEYLHDKHLRLIAVQLPIEMHQTLLAQLKSTPDWQGLIVEGDKIFAGTLPIIPCCGIDTIEWVVDEYPASVLEWYAQRDKEMGK